MDRAHLSKLRKQLLATQKRRAHLLERIIKAKAMVKGKLVQVSRKCGKPNCHCATEEGHVSKYLYTSEAGRMVRRYVPAKDEVKVARGSERYRALRKARAELAKLAKETLDLIDELQQGLTLPYPPPDDHHASPLRRGRSGGGTKIKKKPRA